MDRAEHFEAMLARARERPALEVHDTTVPLNSDGTVARRQYVVLHDLGADELGDERYTAPQQATSACTMRYVARCVGVDPTAARHIADAVRAQFLRWVPTVPGRSCWPVVLDQEGDVEEDRDVSPPLSFIDIDFTFRSNPGG